MSPQLITDLITVFRLEALTSASAAEAERLDSIADELEDRLVEEEG
jgi:hypothetical protein